MRGRGLLLQVLFRAHVAEVLCLKANPMNGTFITGGNGQSHAHATTRKPPCIQRAQR